MSLFHYTAVPRAQLLRTLFDNTAAPADAGWQPRVDVREESTRFVILADLPGVDPESIDVQMDKGVLTIRGAFAAAEVVDGERYSRRERASGAFSRRFVLPDVADAESITASGRHGVLEVVIPKRAESTPRRIQVQ